MEAVFSSKILYSTIHKLRYYTDYEIDLYEIEDKIRENEDWAKYFTEGFRGIDLLYSNDEKIITNMEGNLYKFL
jgi:hypothetical protein